MAYFQNGSIGYYGNYGKSNTVIILIIIVIDHQVRAAAVTA